VKWILFGVVPGIGGPVGLTMLFAPQMTSWTPLAVLLLLGLIATWIVGAIWVLGMGIAIYADE